MITLSCLSSRDALFVIFHPRKNSGLQPLSNEATKEFVGLSEVRRSAFRRSVSRRVTQWGIALMSQQSSIKNGIPHRRRLPTPRKKPWNSKPSRQFGVEKEIQKLVVYEAFLKKVFTPDGDLFRLKFNLKSLGKLGPSAFPLQIV
jgi:hypothetical protein